MSAVIAPNSHRPGRAPSDLQRASDLQDIAPDGYQSDSGITGVRSVLLPGIRTESGYQFDLIRVAYQTHGTLSPGKDNAILVCHALSGDAHVAGISEQTGRPGWWDYYVGPGRALDTSRYFVIASNVLGGCSGTTGPASAHPSDGSSYGARFPPITIRDMVQVQARLLDYLGISQLFAVVGGSMGGMQALRWALDFPDCLRVCVPIATALAHSPMQIAFNHVGRHAIASDPAWRGGSYDRAHRPVSGLALARMAGHVTYLSQDSMEAKFGRQSQPVQSGETSFSVESYLTRQGKRFVERFDPNSYICLTKAIDRFNLLEEGPECLRRVASRLLIVAFQSDWLYPPAQTRQLVKSFKRAGVPTSYLELDSRYGHDSFLIENPPFAAALRDFLLANNS